MDDDATQTMDPVRPAVPIARARPTPVPAPPPSRVQTIPGGMTLAPGEVQALVTEAALAAVNLNQAQTRAADASADTDITINLQRTVSRLKAAVAAVVLVGTGLLTVLNWYGDQRVAAAAESERRLEVGKALETISTQHRVDQLENRKTHTQQATDAKALGVLQIEQGKETRRLIRSAVPEARRTDLALPRPELAEAEAAVLGPPEP